MNKSKDIKSFRICHIFPGDLSWSVSQRVTEYGQTATLLCVSESCNSKNCNFRAGWDRYAPNFTPTFAVVRHQHILDSAKYSGKLVENGFTLEIRKLSERDLNVSYECSVSYNKSSSKVLLKKDVFETIVEKGICKIRTIHTLYDIYIIFYIQVFSIVFISN